MAALRDFVDEGPVGKRRLPQLSRSELGLEDDDEDAPEQDNDDRYPDVLDEAISLDSLDA
jgi:hypothetical protein